MYYLYILECSDKSLYTGISNNLRKRFDMHNKGKASKYTRSRLPVKPVYIEEVGSKSMALKREIEIKKLKRPAKLKLVETGPNNILSDFK